MLRNDLIDQNFQQDYHFSEYHLFDKYIDRNVKNLTNGLEKMSKFSCIHLSLALEMSQEDVSCFCECSNLH